MAGIRSLMEAVRRYLNAPEAATGETPFEIRPDDVFLCSYPRSGNVWVRYMLLHCVVPDDSVQAQDLLTTFPNLHGDLTGIANLPSPRVFKTHFTPRQEYPKVIYLFRDGRDMCVSYYDYRKRLSGYGGSFDEFVRQVCLGQIWPGPWHSHVRQSLDQASSERFLVVKYEDMLEDARRELRRIVDFAGFDVSRDILDAAVQKSTIQRIWKEIQAVPRHRAIGFKGGVSGGQGKWKEHFTDELHAFFLRHAGAVLRKCGYEERL